MRMGVDQHHNEFLIQKNGANGRRWISSCSFPYVKPPSLNERPTLLTLRHTGNEFRRPSSPRDYAYDRNIVPRFLPAKARRTCTINPAKTRTSAAPTALKS